MEMKIPRFAVVLSGCGVFDGAEIHEAVLTMLAIERAGAQYQCFAPNTWQARTIDHFTGNAIAIAGDEDNRNVLAESARICRGQVKDLAEFQARDFEGIVFPGGFGAALNLSNFAVKGAECEVNEEVRRALEESYRQGLVIGAMCIAPVVIARVLGKEHIRLTIGNDKNTAAGLAKMGALPEERKATEVCVDEEHKIVTTPCYMLARSMVEIADGTANLVSEMLDLMDY